MANLIKSGLDIESINEEKTKLGSWLRCLAVRNFPNLTLAEENQMGWEKAVFILLWNARVQKLNSVFPPSPALRPLFIADFKAKNILNETVNSELLKGNRVLENILNWFMNQDLFDTEAIYNYIYSLEDTKKHTPPDVLILISLFQVIPDFSFKPVG